MIRTKYLVTTKHPTGFMDGDHVMTVNTWPDGKRFVDAIGFGCSRDYAVDTDESAIRAFLPEHAMRAVRIVKHDS